MSTMQTQSTLQPAFEEGPGQVAALWWHSALEAAVRVNNYHAVAPKWTQPQAQSQSPEQTIDIGPKD